MPLPLTVENVLAALRHVDDPDLKRDLVTLNMVRDVQIQGPQVSFTVVLTTPACPMKEVLHRACVTAIHTLVDPAAVVDVTLTANVTTAETGGPKLPGVRNVIAVASGKGGVGKSTVAANLALALVQQGARVGLVDADIYGPSVPTLFGLEGERPLTFDDPETGKTTLQPIERHGLKLMSIGFMVPPGQAIVWRGPMASNALRQLFVDTAWGELDYLVVDLPPGTGDIHITVAQQFPITGAVMVTTPQLLASADVRKAIAMMLNPQIHVPLLGIVENMAWFEAPELPGRRYYLFGQGGGQQLADEYNLPLLAQLPLLEPPAKGPMHLPVVQAPESGLAQALVAFAQRVAQQVSVFNAQVVAA
jgi:ATP-binding protein involved in chromosome partitioning